MCCGTHVSNLSHLQVPTLFPLPPHYLPLPLTPPLQCIKLLHTESKKGSTLLYYIAGGRVVHYLGRAYSNERSLNKLLRLVSGVR